MARTNRTVQNLVKLESPTRRSEGSTQGTETQLDPGCTYSRFSLALIRHPAEPPYTGDRVVDRASVIVPFLHQLLAHEPSECFGALFLTARRHPIGHAIPFRGTLSQCRVEPRQLLVMALAVNASSLALFHNHPSGDPSPTPEDQKFAYRFRDAADLVGVSLFDFIILGEPPSYYSFRDGHRVKRRLARPAGHQTRRRRPKYRHPDEPSLTWAGTGFMPVWLREEIEGRACLADFLVEGAQITEAAARQEREAKDRARLREVADREPGR